MPSLKPGRKPIRSLLLSVLAVLLGLAFLTQSRAQTASVTPEAPSADAAFRPPFVDPYVTNELIFKLAPGSSEGALREILEEHSARIRRHLTDVDVYQLRLNTKLATIVLPRLQSRPDIVWVELNYTVQGEGTPSDPDYNNASLVYAPKLINAEPGWDISTGVPTIVVAIVDSGISLNHPEFAGRIVPGRDIIHDEDPLKVNDPSDDNGHGTHVAGIVAAAMNNGQGTTGIAPNVRLLPVKVLDANNYGTWADIAAGIIWATNQGADIINLSLGGAVYSQVLRDAVTYAASHGVFVVAAAGNDFSSAPFYPAAFEETLAVSASTPDDAIWDYSNFGSAIDIAAPGLNIWSTYRNSSDPTAYAFLTGTSMAAAHASGLAALLLSQESDLTTAELRGLIENTAVDRGATGIDPYFGKGRIDVGAALAAVQSTSVASVTGFVFFDANGNGLRDAGEMGLTDAAIDLKDTATGGQTFSAATTSQADGSYAFNGLIPGAYTVSQIPLSGYLSTTPLVSPVQVFADQETVNDFGHVVPRTVGGTVFQDADQDGAQGLTEAPIPDSMVEVFDDANGNGQADPGETVLGSDVSDEQGNYSIGNLLPGTRVLRIQPPGGAGQSQQTALPVVGGQLGGSATEVNAPVVAGRISAPNEDAKQAQTAEAVCANNRLTVRFAPAISQKTIDSILDREGMQIKRAVAPLGIYVVLLSGLASPERAEGAVTRLDRLPEVDYAVRDCKVSGDAVPSLHPTDPAYNDVTKVYAPQLVGAESAWNYTTGAPSVIVAVLDTGVSMAHPEFAGRIMQGIDYVNEDADAMDDNGHGTHVAGIALAGMNNSEGIVGMAPSVLLMPVKVLAASNSGYWSDTIAGITYAVDHGAKVINLSLSGAVSDPSLPAALQYAVDHDVLVVAAMGNAGSSTPEYPSYFDQTFAVAATTSTDVRWSLSNYGSHVDISAPGATVYSTLWSASNANGYGNKSGTSMAAPHVTGLAALIRSLYPNLSVADVRAIIQQSAVDKDTAGWDQYYGWGRINAGAALALAQTWSSPTATPPVASTATPSPTFTSTPVVTSTPTRTPTLTSTPTLAPTATSTRTPTATPTATSAPTATPTGTPTTAPNTPTFTPTATPTRTPTTVPTNTPTPTVTPTTTPTRTPTTVPTNTPTTTPTRTPTTVPTNTPVPTATPSFTATPAGTATPTATPYVRRVNSGGTSSYTDAQGRAWAVDQAYASGSWGYSYSSSSAKSSSYSLSNTSDDALYQRYREGVGEYRFTVPNGNYQVWLRWAEMVTSTVGGRVMRVIVEGVTVESSLDIRAMAGNRYLAYDKTYQTTVTDGLLTVRFEKVSGYYDAMIAGIEVSQTAPP